ncbi:hypothetical protein [Lactococcus lactis]|uniref:hypothetical protein n=1 Tax=Lactococcus lactis TaxID=1358 RepID=UPI001D1926D0|nr:hypothetical protein [Lactococcus lactis]MCC4121703.1 hypothetical protein [Lactococcus lactis]
MNWDTLITPIVTSVLSTGTLGLFINWRIVSSQKRQDKGIIISDELLKKIFNIYYFDSYNESFGKINKEITKKIVVDSFNKIKKEQENFLKLIEEEKLSAYIFELKKDSKKIIKLIDNFIADTISATDEKFYDNHKKRIFECVESYDAFAIRFEEALRRYRKNVGSKTSPQQTREARNMRNMYTVLLLFIPLIISYILVNSKSVNNMLSQIKYIFVLFAIILSALGIIIIYIFMIRDIWHMINNTKIAAKISRIIKNIFSK